MESKQVRSIQNVWRCKENIMGIDEQLKMMLEKIIQYVYSSIKLVNRLDNISSLIRLVVQVVLNGSEVSNWDKLNQDLGEKRIL